MTFEQEYPEAYQDMRGTIWTSYKAAADADWTYEHGDAFLGDILGWDWDDARENYAVCQRERRRKAFWRSHPRLRDAIWFVRRRWGFTRLFLSTVWRDWYGRISWSTAWQISKDIWL